MTTLITAALLVVQFGASTELGYRFALPAGFEAFPEGRAQPGIVDCWTESEQASPSGALVLCVQRLGGTLSRGETMPGQGSGAMRPLTFKWKGFDIGGLRSDTTQAGDPISVLLAQVPLRREAVQLIVAGPRDQAERAQAILEATLATLEGETNWLTDAERAERLGNIGGMVLVVLVVVVGFRIWRRRQGSRAG